MSWTLKRFDELSLHELYSILQMRNAVFIVEQNCPYQDLDNRDFQAYHLFYRQDSSITAYCRILPAGLAYPEISIGRLLSAKSVRRTGQGRQLMKEALSFIAQHWPHQDIKISAQKYLEEFYAGFGFRSQGKEYLEDNIPHVEMVLDGKTSQYQLKK